MFTKRYPLFLPRGSVRAILALLLAASAITGFMLGMVPADVFMPMVTMAVAFYFGNRSADGKESN